MIPAINDIADIYNTLGFKVDFNEEIFRDILSNGIKNIRNEYYKAVKDDIKKMKVATLAITGNLAGKVEETLMPLEAAINTLRDIEDSIIINSSGAFTPISYDDIKFIERRPQLKLDQFEKRFQTIIETETQSNFYQSYIDLKDAWEKTLQLFLTSCTQLDRTSFYGANGFFEVDADQFTHNYSLLLNVKAISSIQ